MRMIKCDYCNQTGTFDVNLNFEYENTRCNHCNHSQQYDWKYHFCNLTCFFTWLKENNIEEEGFLCKSCNVTGFAYGHKENGPCAYCDGTKRVKVSKEKIR